MKSPQSPLAALALRAAVFAGAGTALVSVWNQVPLRIACLRGAGAWLGTLFVAGLFRALVQLSMQADRARRQGGKA